MSKRALVLLGLWEAYWLWNWLSGGELQRALTILLVSPLIAVGAYAVGRSAVQLWRR